MKNACCRLPCCFHDSDSFGTAVRAVRSWKDFRFIKDPSAARLRTPSYGPQQHGRRTPDNDE